MDDKEQRKVNRNFSGKLKVIKIRAIEELIQMEVCCQVWFSESKGGARLKFHICPGNDHK